ncbi:MAG: hypothetical protein ABI861_03200 [Panacibacter sp.]
MVSFFKEKSATAVFGLVIVSIGTRLFFWEHHPQIVTSADDGLIYLLLTQLLFLPIPAIGLLYHFIVVFQALRLNYALDNLRMFPKPCYTTALAYVILTALIPAWNNISSALVINGMVIWLLFRLLKLYSSSSPKSLLYNIGLIISCTVILYYATMPLILLAFVAVAVYRPFRINEWMILLLGILTPIYFLAGYLFLNDQLEAVLNKPIIFKLQIIRPANLAITIATFIFTSIVIITGAYLWQSNSGRMVIQVRKNWSILFFMVILLIPGVFFIKNTWPDALLLAAPAAAAFVSNTWQYPKKNLLPALLFWSFIAVITYNNWFVVKF